MIAAGRRKRTQESKWWGFGHRAQLGRRDWGPWGCWADPLPLSPWGPVVPSLDVAPLGEAGSLGVGGPLTKRGCENVGVPGFE